MVAIVVSGVLLPQLLPQTHETAFCCHGGGVWMQYYIDPVRELKPIKNA